MQQPTKAKLVFFLAMEHVTAKSKLIKPLQTKKFDVKVDAYCLVANLVGVNCPVRQKLR